MQHLNMKHVFTSERQLERNNSGIKEQINIPSHDSKIKRKRGCS
jgi:hypothetical protein